MKMKDFFRKTMMLIMAMALALPLVTSCKEKEPDPNDPDNPGGGNGGGNVTALVGTQWDCDTNISVATMSLSVEAQLEFLTATTGNISIEIMGSQMPAIDINYTFDGTNGTITPATYDGTINFHKTDAGHITLAMTADFLGGSMDENPYTQIFALLGGSLNLVFTPHTNNGGGNGGGGEGDTTGNYLSYNGVSANIGSAFMGSEDGMYMYQFSTTGQKSFVMGNPSDLVTGSYTFPGGSDEGNLVGYYLDAQADLMDFVASGTMNVVKTGDNYVININATTESGKAVILHYEGEIVDINAPSGSGSLTIAGHTVSLTMGLQATITENGITYSELVFSDADFTNSANFVKLGNEFTAGSYNLTDEEGVMAGGAMAMLGYYDEDSDETVEAYSTSGNLTIRTDGSGEFTVMFGGTSDLGAFTGNYTGSINTVTMKAQMAKSRAIVKKMRRR